LKNKYGSGFRISVSCDPADRESVCEYLRSRLPSGAKVMDNFLGTVSFEFEAQEISSLFKEIGENREQHGIKFWGISQTT